MRDKDLRPIWIRREQGGLSSRVVYCKLNLLETTRRCPSRKGNYVGRISRSVGADAAGLDTRTLAMGVGIVEDFDPFERSHERAYSLALMRLNELIAVGLDEDSEGDAVRDEMDMHWYRMDDRQRQRMRHLSVDLKQLSNAKEKPDYIGPVDREWADELQLARKLPGIEGADRILAVLRDQRAGRPSGNFFFIQAKQYERLGMPEVARAFYDAAEARSVDNLKLLSVA